MGLHVHPRDRQAYCQHVLVACYEHYNARAGSCLNISRLLVLFRQNMILMVAAKPNIRVSIVGIPCL